MGVRFLQEARPSLRFLPEEVPRFLSEDEIGGIVGGGPLFAEQIPATSGAMPKLEGIDFIPTEEPKVKFLTFPEDTPETLLSEPGGGVEKALIKTFVPSLSPGAVLPLGEATAFFDDIAEPTTGLADDPFRNLRTVMNLGFMASPTTIPFAIFSLARHAIEDLEQPMLRHMGQLSEPTRFDTHAILMSEVHVDAPLFSKILGDLELLYLVGIGARSVGEAERLVERSLRTNGRRLDAKTVEDFLEKPLVSATEADVREIISARQATNNRVSGKKFLDELKAKGFKEDAERWKRFMIEERQAGSEAAQTAKINNDIRGELPEVSKSTMDAVYPVRQSDVPAVVKQARSEPGVILDELDLKIFPEEIKSHNSVEFDVLEPALIKAREELVVSINASGESAASLEALSVETQRKAKGIQHIIVDSRSGVSRPAIGPRPEDNPLNPHDMLVKVEDGSAEIVNKGKSAIDRPGVIEKATAKIVGEQEAIPSRVALEETKLAETVTEVVGIKPPPIGLGIRKVGKPTPKELGEFKFEDAEIEKRFSNAKGVPEVSFAEKLKGKLAILKNRSTRTFELLPNTSEFAEIKLLLIRLNKRTIQADQATRVIEGITKKLDKKTENIFSRKVILDDLSFEAAEGREIPFGFTKEEVINELARIDSVIARSPEIQGALKARNDLWESLRKDYVKSAQLAGINLEGRFKNPVYFRHQVLDHARNKGFTDNRIRKPSGSYLKTRGGSQLDINTNYIEAEYEVLSNMLHDIEMYKFWAKTKESFDIKSKLVEEFGDEWRSNVPEGMERFQFDEGHFFYHANTIPEKIANQLLAQGLKQIGISADDIGVAMAVGGLRNEVVIPSELAQTLRDPFPEQKLLPIGIKAVRLWKVWAITSPRRIGRTQIRNQTGDLENVYLGNPRGFRFAAQSSKELYQTLVGDGAMTPEMREWFKRGGFESTLIFQELQDLNKLPTFKHIRDVKTPIRKLPAKAFFGYWKKARLAVNFRESILRYSNYLEYLEQMKKSSIGAPANFGASIPEEIMGLPDMRDRAYKLSNDLLGAYDEITVMGRAVRNQLIPFWSFQELNMRKYFRMIKNLKDDKKTMELIGRAALPAVKMATRTAIRIGTFIFAASSLWVATNAWNMTYFPDVEGELPEDIRSRPHIIFGRKKNGDPLFFSRIGVLGDFLEWFGLDNFPSQIQAFLSGQKTLPEIANEMWKSPINKAIGGSRPFIKLMAEMASRRTFFPDLFEPRTIRDRGFHISRAFGLGNEYVALMRLPSSGYMDSMSDFFAYSSNPGETAYFGIIDKKNRFMKKTLGKLGEGFFFSPKGNALYNYKLAIRLDDEDAKSRFLTEYVRLSGLTSEKKIKAALTRTIQSADPLFGLKAGKKGQADEKTLFVSTLDEEGQRQLVRAIHFYEEVIKGRD